MLRTPKIVIVKLCESQIRLLKVSLFGNGYLKNFSTSCPSPDFSSSYNCLYEVAWSWVYGCWWFRAVALVLNLVEKLLWNCIFKLLATDWWVISRAQGPAPKPLSCKEPALQFLPVHFASTLWKTHPRPAWISSIAKYSSLCACQQQLLLLVSTGTLC